jgi:HEPN domain-containing protein
MKEKIDLVRRWWRKAGSDIAAIDALLSAGAFDTACFHAQQAAERALKAYLLSKDTEFPPTHNLSKLVELCSRLDASFGSLMALVESLTPYAVELRYDDEFWPSEEVAQEARRSALAVKQFVMDRLPEQIVHGMP